MKVGLFFGTYNPIHVGHLIIANYMANHTELEEVWLIVSPHNPLKEKSTLLNEYDRLHLVELAIRDNDKLKVSNIEFSLPKPSYTIHTLTYLKEKHPQHDFNLIMGSDNLKTFHKWMNYEKILAEHKIFLYNRPKYSEGELINHPHVFSFDVPLLSISASFIRKSLKAGKSIKYLVTEPVEQYIDEMNLYQS